MPQDKIRTGKESQSLSEEVPALYMALLSQENGLLPKVFVLKYTVYTSRRQMPGLIKYMAKLSCL